MVEATASAGRLSFQDWKRGGVFHTWTAQSVWGGAEIVKASGCRLYGPNHESYIDFASQMFNVNLGHSHPRLLEKLKQAVKDVQFVSSLFGSPQREDAAQALREIMPPSLTHVLFTTGGATSIEAALKIAWQYTGRRKVVSRRISYHGATYGAMAISGDPQRLLCEPQVYWAIRVPTPGLGETAYLKETIPRDYLSETLEILDSEDPSSIAAFVMEPICSAPGPILFPPNNYLEGIREYCTKNGILLIFDEILTGFGRTGSMFGFDHWNVLPDLLCLGKGITSGYFPMGAVAVEEKVSEYFWNHTLNHGMTYSGHPLGCCLITECVKILREEGILEKWDQLESIFRDALHGMAKSHPSCSHPRGKGAYWAFEFVHPQTGIPVSKRPLKYPLEPHKPGPMALVASRALELGLYLYTRMSSAILSPPLTIEEGELQEALEMLNQVLTFADEELGKT